MPLAFSQLMISWRMALLECAVVEREHQHATLLGAGDVVDGVEQLGHGSTPCMAASSGVAATKCVAFSWVTCLDEGNPRRNWNEYPQWDGLPLQGEYHCWLFHDLCDHVLGYDWGALLGIGKIWTDVMLIQQRIESW